MVGKTLSHYRILERLGSGGMGLVYRARDLRLERDVALKVLPEGSLAASDARGRFRREALALSRLNHPSVATVFDFDHQDGNDFLVMELVEGETLDARLGAGALPEKEIVDLGLQIAEALEAAHEQGVVHRDLKPSNIAITRRGRVKVLDFGIASLLQRGDPQAAITHTGGGAALGTLPYMAPEVLLGQRSDARSDLYALGAVLYEMATGRRPFLATLDTALVYEITNSDPPPPGRIRHDLSTRLEDMILKCLEKNPDYRYQSVRELAVDLRRLGARAELGADYAAPLPGPRSGRIRSLAVLPLENLSGDPEQEYFADGMTDALIADLAQIGALRVISRTSVMRYKRSRKPLPEIARELSVEAVVEGSVVRAGDRVRITARLFEAATDRLLWSRSYQRDLCDVLELQGEVAGEIAKEIRVKLTPQEETRLAVARPVDPRAYEAYLKGRHFWSRRTEADVRRGIAFFERAIEADPAHALAYAGLADSYNILGDLDVLPSEEATARAKAAATRALEMDDRLAEAHTSVGFYRLFFEWDWDGAEAAFRRAISLNPGYPTARQWYAEFLVTQGRFEEALAEARLARELDPLALVIGTTLADVLFFSRRYDEAIEQLRRVLEMDPGFGAAHSDLGRVLTMKGLHEEAIAAFRTADPLFSRRGYPGLGHAYAAAGRREEANRILADLKVRRSGGVVSGHAIAVIHAALGETDHALEWLETAHRDRDRAMVWLGVHPRLDGLRQEPRFTRLLRSMKLAR